MITTVGARVNGSQTTILGGANSLVFNVEMNVSINGDDGMGCEELTCLGLVLIYDMLFLCIS